MFRLFLPSESNTLVIQGLVCLLRNLHGDWKFEVGAADVDPGHEFLPRVMHLDSGRWLAIVDDAGGPQAAARALNAGATAVVLHSSTVQELEGALQSLVTSAASYAPPAVIRALATRAVSANRVPTAARSSPSLSAREKEILSLISRGDTNSEVAQKLGISVNTVRTHLQTLSSKLNVSGRVNLAGMAWSIALGEDGEAPAAKHAPRQSSASGVRGGAAG